MEELYRKKAKRKLVALAFYLILLTGCALLLMKQGTGRTLGEDELEIHFLSLGKADSILIRTGDQSMLIDAGWETTADEVRKYLKMQGISKLDYAVATHEDEDHIGGMEEILRRFQVNKLLISPKIGENEAYRAMIQRADKRQTKIEQPKIPSTFSLGKAEITILAPGPAALADGQVNNSSLVLYLTFGKRSFLFMGDALLASEEELLQEGYRIKADVLKAGHHGFDDATGENFLDTVSPRLVVITCHEETASKAEPHSSENPPEGSKHFGRIESRLKEKGILAYYTGERTLILSCDGERIEAR